MRPVRRMSPAASGRLLNNIMRARCFALAVCAVALHAMNGAALAQSYPSKPVRFVVPYTPGGGTDLMARALAQRLTENIGQSFIVENQIGRAHV